MNMKILVISDTHGYIGNAVSLIEEMNPDYIVHLGDIASDCDELVSIYPMKRIICVLGNNDFFCKNYPIDRVAQIGDKIIYMCHGHKCNVKAGLELLKRTAREKNADIVLFGHTHRAFVEQTDDMLIMNPGSTRTYGVITIENGKVTGEVFDI